MGLVYHTVIPESLTLQQLADVADEALSLAKGVKQRVSEEEADTATTLIPGALSVSHTQN